jgi:large subunit ribosomal protein L16
MLIFPGKMKFKKYQKQRGRFKGLDVGYSFPKRAFYGLKALGPKRIKANHLEAIRRYIQRRIKKKMREKLQICVFPDLPATRKSSGIRMGKGKGAIEYWCTPVFTGRILFELGKSVNKNEAFWSFSKASVKLPVKSKFVTRKKFHHK